MNKSYPVKVAEYAEANKLSSKPVFAWWSPFTIKKRELIIGAAKARLKKKTHKYGMLVPNTVNKAYIIDKEAGNTIWRDSISKEMKNNRVAFQVLNNDEAIPPGRTFLECHMIFDVNMDFTRKSCFVANGEKRPTQKKAPTLESC